VPADRPRDPQFLGFGKQSFEGPATAPDIYMPFVQSHQEQCEICDGIFNRADMHSVGFDMHGDLIYICSNAHPPEAR